ncbi:MAG: sigma-54 dependent transcriptional regulator [Acidobacteria bacterium]|nr:sigma-54 dependent transcriptional regulator [Acidobacteriota bacterium]
MLQRFNIQGDQAHDHWQNEKLTIVSIPGTPENLERLHGIFAFRSSLLQNIADVAPDHFRIRVLTQPFIPSRPADLARLPEKATAGALRQTLAFLAAAGEWNLDFVDFSRFQLLPTGTLRFAWRLEPQELPPAAAIISLFERPRRGRGRPEPEPQGALAGSAPPPLAGDAAYLCRREDFASNLLHSGSPGSLRSCANAKIRINSKRPWQGAVARDNLFHNLNDAETLLLNIDLRDLPLSAHIAALAGGKDAGEDDLAAQARKFRLFLTKSVFQKAVLLLDRLARREDDRLLRFLLESGDISGLTAVLFDDATACDCDLEFNEDPANLLSKHLPAPPEDSPALDDRERELLELLHAIGVPVPRESARLLYAPGNGRDPSRFPEGDACIAALLKRRLLVENRETRGLLVNHPSCPPLGCRDAGAALTQLAMKSEWAYARIAHLIAAGCPAALEDHLKKMAGESPGRVAPGPAADLLCRHLPLLPAGGRAPEYGIDILIHGNCLDQAAHLLAAIPDAAAPWARLKKAHLAMRRRDYPELRRLLAGMAPPARESRDEWLYLNFILNAKTSPRGKADAFAGKIRSAYYRNLALIQQSDRSIYNREFAKAKAQLAAALDYFSAGQRRREEIEARSQMAKLLREEGDFTRSESLYKTIFVQAEADRLALSSAGAAVDLGNLYAENDDDFQAECWYQKAAKLYAREKNRDGIMLVNANLVNVFLAKGDWPRADDLLRGLLAWDEEKKLLDSSAIDLLNWAGLETLRLHDEKALQLIERAEAIFRGSANSKGLSECAYRRGCLCGFKDKAPASGGPWFSADQEAVRSLFRLFAAAGDGREVEMARQLQAIGSRKTRFEALRLLLKKYRRNEWLERFKELALELSPRAKNYYFYEYWYMFFDLVAEGPPAGLRDEFLAMHDFFSANKREVSARLTRLRQRYEEGEQGLGLFADAHLVEQHRQWRLPVDFFNGFQRAISREAPVDWLLMSVHEKQRPLFHFASSDQFRDLGEEMLLDAAAAPQNQNHGLAEVQGKYHSPERLFYPFACTKLIRWPLAEDILACLVIGSRDGALFFQDFYNRHRELFGKFSLLFRNFLQNEYRIDEKLDFIVGASQAIREMKRRIAQVSKVDFSLLVSGESGSGKELVARAVHLLSARAGQPFISVNAAAIPDTLLEAELFGFRKGAFSGAGENRVGLLEAADRGTLFLDEIADLPLALQAKLLRALQEREIRRLGENKTVHVDVRLVSASNRDLGELIRKNLFREDLFYRLQDLVIRIPPLRERRDDIPLLIGHFLKKFGYPDQGADRLEAMADMFRGEEFPGNVRELESRIKNMITFNPELELPAGAAKASFSWKAARQEHEKDLLLKTLKEMNGQRNRTAEKLGISRMALFNLLKKYRISP